MMTLFKKWFWKIAILFWAAIAVPTAFAATRPPINCDQTSLVLDGNPSVIFNCTIPAVSNYGWVPGGTAICQEGSREDVFPLNSGSSTSVPCTFNTPGLHKITVVVNEPTAGGRSLFSQNLNVDFCSPNFKSDCAVTVQNNDDVSDLSPDCTVGYFQCNAERTGWIKTSGGVDKCFVWTMHFAAAQTGQDTALVPIECGPQVNACYKRGACQTDGSCSAQSPRPENAIIFGGAFSGQICCQNKPNVCAEQEICNGCDDNCDGTVDNNPVDVGQACDNGLQGTCNRTGQIICDATQKKPVCTALTSVSPGMETCNGIDDNCDDIVDNVSGVGMACSNGAGDCAQSGTQQCNTSTGQLVCSASPKPDGTACKGADLCTVGTTCQSGICRGGTSKLCDDDNVCTTDGCNTKDGSCTNRPRPNGTHLTGGFCNNGVPVTCMPGATQDCTLKGNTNACKKGQQLCSASGTWETCSAVNVADNTLCNDQNACTQTDTCQSGACIGSNPAVCAAASDTCHVAGICNPQTGKCSPETEIKGKPTPSACQNVICSAGQWTLVDKPTKLQDDKCHTLQCGATGWTLVEKPECIVKAIVLPEGSAASSKIFDVAKRADDPDSDNRTCTILLNSFDSVNGTALFYSGDFEKQFLIVTGVGSAGVGKLALIPPKAMGELGNNCQDLGNKIQYRDLSGGPLEKVATTQISGKNALIGVFGREYCYYPDIDQILQPAAVLPAPICIPTGDSRIWQAAGANLSEEYCDISKIDTFKEFSFGNTSYLVGGVECGGESVNVAGLDICNKTAQEDLFQCSFVTLQKLEAEEKVTYFRLAASDREGKIYAVLETKDGNNLSKKLIEVSKDTSGWNPVAQDISEIPGVIISKDKIKRDLPASEASGNKIFVTESGEVQEMKEEAGQSRVERHNRVHGSFVDARETADARFAPDDNAWNVYGNKDCGIMGEQITLDANNNPGVAVLKDENLTADSASPNNLSNDPILRLCHPKYLVPLTRKNYGGTDLAAIFEVFDTSIANSPKAAGFALSFFYNINEKPKLEPKSSAWDGTNGAVKFETSDAAHDALKNSVQSFKDASGNDISCWVDKIEENQVLFTKKGSCQPGASNITLNALPSSVSTAHSLSAAKAADSGVGKEPLTMVVCATDHGNASGCNSFQLSKAVAVVGGVAEAPGEVAVAVTGETDAGTPMSYKISGGCSLVEDDSNDGFIACFLSFLTILFFLGLERKHILRGRRGSNPQPLP